MSAYSAVVLAKIPLWYSRLGDTQSPFTDLSGNGNNGPITGGITPSQAGLLVADADPAALFDGTTGRIMLGNPALFQISNGTIEAWIQTLDMRAAFHAILVKQNAYGLFLNTGKLVFWNWGSFDTGGLKDSGIVVADGNRHHVVETFQSGVLNGTKLYIDGVLVYTASMAVVGQATELDLSYGNASQFFQGIMDEVALYGSVLTPDQVMDNYRTGIGNYKVHVEVHSQPQTSALLADSRATRVVATDQAASKILVSDSLVGD